MTDTDYTASMPFGFTILFTPDDGAPSAVTVDKVLDADPPAKKFSEVSFTPLDGTAAGKEHVLAGKEEKCSTSAMVIYQKAYYQDLLAICGLSGTFLLTLSDGLAITATGILSETTLEKFDDTNLMKSKLTWGLDAGWTAA